MKDKKLLCLLFTAGLLGCTSWIPLRYPGKYPELLTVAIHSMLGVRGFHPYTHAGINILEEDGYGRVLFRYGEGDGSHWLIAQKSDSMYVYYYPDVNFMLGHRSNGLFTAQELIEFKDNNDWGRPLNEGRFIRQRIVRQKERDRSKETLSVGISKESVGYNVVDTDDRIVCCRCLTLTTDADGKTTFLCSVKHPITGEWDWIHIVVMINADGSYDPATGVMRLTDIHDYQDELAAFKALNNWVEPWAIPR